MADQTKPSTSKRDANLIWDRIIQVAAGLGLLALAYEDILRHVKTTMYPVNVILASLGMGFLLYHLIAPRFRHY